MAHMLKHYGPGLLLSGSRSASSGRLRSVWLSVGPSTTIWSKSSRGANSHSGSKVQYRGEPEIMSCRILRFMRSLGPYLRPCDVNPM